jgi:hypothetical protein
MIPTTVLLFLNPTYAIFLDEKLDIKSDSIGYFFAIGCGAYVLLAPLMGIA